MGGLVGSSNHERGRNWRKDRCAGLLQGGRESYHLGIESGANHGRMGADETELITAGLKTTALPFSRGAEGTMGTDMDNYASHAR